MTLVLQLPDMFKYVIASVFLLIQVSVFGQLFFTETFEYKDFTSFKINSLDKRQWTFFHAENQDFNNNRQIEKWENIKSIDFVKTPESSDVIRFSFFFI